MVKNITNDRAQRELVVNYESKVLGNYNLQTLGRKLPWIV